MPISANISRVPLFEVTSNMVGPTIIPVII
jgi:hypothetical protein